MEIKKLNKREEKLQKGLEIFEIKDYNQNLAKINNIMLVKKIFSDIPKIRAKFFLDKLKKIQINKIKYEKLKKSLKKGKVDLLNKNKTLVMDKLYKMYAYNKLNNMFNILNKNLVKKAKPYFSKHFIKKLYNNRSEKMKYNYGNQLKSINKAKTTKFNFNKKIISNKANDIVEDKNAPIKKCLPYFVKFLQRKINYKIIDVLERLQDNARHKKFEEIMRNYAVKSILNPKAILVDFIYRDAKYSASRPIYQIKLFKLFRRKFIQELYYSLEEPAKLYQLYYLVNVTSMHKKITIQRFYRELIRKWRFAAFAKKMARKKLELMYKNLHASYLQMADEFFGEDSVNPSVIKEFEMFGNNVGMFTGENPQIGEEINKKYYANVEKKYIFANGQEEEKVERVLKSDKKRASKKEFSKNDDSAKKDSVKKESTKKESTKKEYSKKDYESNDSAKKETPKKESAKKESAKKESAKKESTKKESPKKESAKKESAKKKSAKKRKLVEEEEEEEEEEIDEKEKKRLKKEKKEKREKKVKKEKKEKKEKEDEKEVKEIKDKKKKKKRDEIEMFEEITDFEDIDKIKEELEKAKKEQTQMLRRLSKGMIIEENNEDESDENGTFKKKRDLLSKYKKKIIIFFKIFYYSD